VQYVDKIDLPPLRSHRSIDTASLCNKDDLDDNLEGGELEGYDGESILEDF